MCLDDLQSGSSLLGILEARRSAPAVFSLSFFSFSFAQKREVFIHFYFVQASNEEIEDVFKVFSKNGKISARFGFFFFFSTFSMLTRFTCLSQHDWNSRACSWKEPSAEGGR
jgi:hypothetical protein